MGMMKKRTRSLLSIAILLLVVCGSISYRARVFGDKAREDSGAKGAPSALEIPSRAVVEAETAEAGLAPSAPSPDRKAQAAVPEGGLSRVGIVRSNRERAEELGYEDIETMVRRAVELAGGLGGPREGAGSPRQGLRHGGLLGLHAGVHEAAPLRRRARPRLDQERLHRRNAANIYGGSERGNYNRTGSLDHDKAKLDRWISDWFSARPAQFAIMDGLQGIQNGPTPCFDQTKTSDIAQDQMNMRLVLASRDCVALDTVESLCMEWDPTAVAYLGYLDRAGIGASRVEDIRVMGERVDAVRKDFEGTAPEGKLRRLKPPEFKVARASLSGGLLSVELRLGPEVRKVEVYRGGEYVGTYRPVAGEALSLDLPGIGSRLLADAISFVAYDAYLSSAKKGLGIMKARDVGLPGAVVLAEPGK